MLVAILILGVFTIWQVRIFAPAFLFNGAVVVYVILLALTLLTWRKFLWSYLVDGVLGLGLVAVAVSQPEHLAIASSGTLILPTFIMIVGDTLALVLGVTSLFVFWKRYSPIMKARRMEHLNVHANCAPDAPCRTDPKYRV